jgi:hypothetical protein
VKRELILSSLLLAGAARAEETIRPGYWEARDQVLSPIHEDKTEHRCIAAKDVARFMTCYINHHYTCQCPEQSYSGGQIRYRGVCVDAKGRQVDIAGRGTYTPDTLHLTADVTFRLGGIPISGRASTDARRIADVCPAEPAGGSSGH